MSNPTELPELDRENLQSWPERIWLQHGAAEIINYAERPRLEDGITWCEDNTDPLDIEYVRADLARRAQPEGEVWELLNELYRLNPTPEAQGLIKKVDRKFEMAAAALRKPEGEAPQAVDVDRALSDAVDAEYPIPNSPHASVIQRAVEGRAAMWRGAMAARRLIAPAAQHADSGTQAVIPRELIERVIERLSKAQIFPLASELRAALAAQSQGALASYNAASEAEIDAIERKHSAQQAAAPAHETIVREGGDLVCTACGSSAPGTPEAPKGGA